MPIKSNKPCVSFHFLKKGFSLTNRTHLKKFIGVLLKKHNKRLISLVYIFCSDDYLLNINQKYLQHDFMTDIISFDLSSEKNSINAEVYISVDRVLENADLYSTTFKRELHRVIFHGVLHLCGFNDKTAEQSLVMRSMEDLNLSLYFRN